MSKIRFRISSRFVVTVFAIIIGFALITTLGNKAPVPEPQQIKEAILVYVYEDENEAPQAFNVVVYDDGWAELHPMDSIPKWAH